MDANRTRYHLFFGAHDWKPLLPATGAIEWNDRLAAITLKTKPFRFTKPPGDHPPRLEDRRGSGVDRYGNVFWIDATAAKIRWTSPNQGKAETYWPPESVSDAGSAPIEIPDDEFHPVSLDPIPAPLRLSGLTVTPEHYMVAGSIEPPGLLIFDLFGGGAPNWMPWPESIGFSPFDMAAGPDGSVFILDRPAPGAAGPARYWALDARFQVVDLGVPLASPPGSPPDTEVPSDFLPAGVTGTLPKQCSADGTISLKMAAPLGMTSPIAIEALPDGSVLVLEDTGDGKASRVHRYIEGLESAGAMVLQIQPLSGIEFPDELPGFVRGHDFAFVADAQLASGRVTGSLFVADSQGNQSFAFLLAADNDGATLDFSPIYFPMRLFAGKALVASGSSVFYDMAETWLSLAEQTRPRYLEKGSLTVPERLEDAGVEAMDGKEWDCVWHRVLMDAIVPEGASLRVESRVANERNQLESEPWRPEPAPYLREGGSELPFQQPFPEGTSAAGTGTWELLLQSARGRFLQLRLTLEGTGRNTPKVRALRAYYPRFSYLRKYLPDVYAEDGNSADFLERYLANAEGMLTQWEDRIAQMQLLFDVRAIPAEYLEWLAGWFGAILDPAWDEMRRRLFLSHAMELFSQKGTVPGLLRFLRLATDPCPDESLFQGSPERSRGGAFPLKFPVRIVENFLYRQAPGVVFGDPTLADTLAAAPASSSWAPENGPGELHRRYQEYLKTVYAGNVSDLNQAWAADYGDFTGITFPPLPPSLKPGNREGEDWNRFVDRGLGFAYWRVVPGDLSSYRNFLTRRYRQIAELHGKYELASEPYASFQNIPFPESLPDNPWALRDWIQFVSVILPSERQAHRFTVLVPTRAESNPGGSIDPELVRRIVEMEKPAHTAFEVKEYWALFRVGEARLGLDTWVDRGSRLTALVLGEAYAGQAYLAWLSPWNEAGRNVLGRDGLTRSRGGKRSGAKAMAS